MVVGETTSMSRQPPLTMPEVPAVRADAAGGVTVPVRAAQSEPVTELEPKPVRQTSAQPAADSPAKLPVPRGFIPPALQNCLRCDACSCIYLDELDYYKHVRNYHSATAQRRYRKSSQCRTCVFSKIEPDQVTTLKSLRQRPAGSAKINVLQNNVKSRWSRMFGSRLKGQLTPLSTSLREIDRDRVPLKAKVKMQAGLQPFVVRELDAKMSAMKRQRAADADAGAIFNTDCDAGATVRVKQEQPGLCEDECVALLQQVEVHIKTEPDT